MWFFSRRKCLTKEEFYLGLAKTEVLLNLKWMHIMGKLEDLQKAHAALKGEVTSLTSAVALSNAKADTVITLLQSVVLQLADLQSGGGADQEDLQALIDDTNAQIADVHAASAAAVAQAAKDDDAVKAASAPPPPPPPPPAPPADDAFVAVGSARMDGSTQTAETLAASVATWNAAHPDDQIPV